MQIACYAFTETGRNLAKRLALLLEKHRHTCVLCLQKNNLQSVEEQFAKAGALLFIGACGIAVRAVAPFIDSKLTDPAVLVMDEMGTYVIPILSGHYGGAGELALELSALTGAEPVITTATDLHGRFAVDVFARKNHLRIMEKERIKLVSGALLQGEQVGCELQLPVEGVLPEGFVCSKARIGICIGYERTHPFEETLHLIPRDVIAGIGCRRGKSLEELENLLHRTLCGFGLDESRMRAIASIDRKADEPGLLQLARDLQVPFLTYSARQLRQLPGEYTSSEFVESKVEVDNVCERSALLAAAGATRNEDDIAWEATDCFSQPAWMADIEWIMRKQAENGMTIAIVRMTPHISF